MCNGYRANADSWDPSEQKKKQVNGHFIMHVEITPMQPNRRDLRSEFTFSLT